MKTRPGASPKYEIAVIGGGIAGLCAAIAMEKMGLHPVVFESAPEIKPLGAGLTLAANAIRALHRLGVADKVVNAGQQLSKFSILDQHGKPLSELDSRVLDEKFGLSNFAIHRADLHRVLLGELSPKTDFVTGKRAVRVEQGDGFATVHFQDGTRHSAHFVLVADGIHSALRQQLLPKSTPRFAGYTCWRAVVENPGLQLDRATETWGAAGRMGIVPLANNLIYWFLCINARQDDPAMRAMRVADLRARFAALHHPIPEILAATRDEQLLWNDILDIAPIQKFAFGSVLLLGDAAHATTPNLGQGACQAIEDAAVLLDEWEKNPGHPEQVFQHVERRRLPRTTFIVNRSRSLGKLAQLENPQFIWLRNLLFRLTPASVNERQVAVLYKTDF